MSDKEKEDLEKFEFLVIKSRNLLEEQFNSYDSINGKAGILISISALLTPIVVTLISDSETFICIKFLTLVPVILMAVALKYLMEVLTTQKLIKGFNFEQFDTQINVEYKELLKYEISANKSSFNLNIETTQSHHRKFDNGVKFIYYSAILIFVLVALSMFLSNKINKEDKKEQITIEQLNIN